MSELKVNTISSNTEAEVTVNDALVVNETLAVGGAVQLSDLSVAGYVKNDASGNLSTLSAVLVADLPTQIPADNIATGIVNNDEFNTLDGIATDKTIQDQFDDLTGPAPAAPTGAMMYWSTETPPSGWVECDGSTHPCGDVAYATLFAVIAHRYTPQTEWPGGSFRLPDCRGLFVRCLAHGSYAWENQSDSSIRIARPDGNVGDAVGTLQVNQNKSHNHSYTIATPRDLYVPGGSYYSLPETIPNQLTGDEGGTETRPNNIVFMMIIKL